MSAAIGLIGWLFCILAGIGGVYTVAVTVIFVGYFSRKGPVATASPPVTLVKPLHGADEQLTESLETYFRQDYSGAIQIALGVKDAEDPAVEVVKALIERHPDSDITLVIDERMHGPNRKVSNLANIIARARHDVLIMSDDDVRVGPDYVRNIVAALAQPGIGAVSPPYLGEPVAGLWSRVAAMSFHYGFLPSAILAKSLGLAEPCFGPTIALTRGVLNEIGGIAAFAEFLAEDFEIGRAVRARGYGIAIPAMTITTLCSEAGPEAVFRHELRWARTIRRIAGAGHVGSVVTHPFALSLIGAALLGGQPAAIGLIFAILGVRIACKLRIDAVTGAESGPWWLLPPRDVLSFVVFVASFSGDTVEWQGQRYYVGRDGVLTEI